MVYLGLRVKTCDISKNYFLDIVAHPGHFKASSLNYLSKVMEAMMDSHVKEKSIKSLLFFLHSNPLSVHILCLSEAELNGLNN